MVNVINGMLVKKEFLTNVVDWSLPVDFLCFCLTGLQIQLSCKESPITVKAAVILGSADLQGKAYLTCMAQHNGECGCLTCEDRTWCCGQTRKRTHTLLSLQEPYRSSPNTHQ